MKTTLFRTLALLAALGSLGVFAQPSGADTSQLQTPKVGGEIPKTPWRIPANQMDTVPVGKIAAAEAAVRDALVAELVEICEKIEAGEALSDADREALLAVTDAAIAPLREDPHADD